MSKLYQIIFLCFIFFISIQGISRNSNDNGPHQELNSEYQVITIELDAFEIYNNYNTNVYSLGFLGNSESKSSLTYTVVAGNRKGIWKIDKNSGGLFLINPENLNNIKEYNYRILIEVRDKSSQQLLSTKPLTILVQIKNLEEYFEYNGVAYNNTKQVETGEKTFNTLHKPIRKNLLIK